MTVALDDLIDIVQFFQTRPEFDAQVQQLLNAAKQNREAAGLYQSVQQVEAKQSKLDAEIAKIESMEAGARENRDLAEAERANVAQEVQLRVEKALEERISSLSGKEAAVDKAKADIDALEVKLNGLIGKAEEDLAARSEALDKKEADLTDLQRTLSGNREKLTADQRAFDERRERLAAAAASV